MTAATVVFNLPELLELILLSLPCQTTHEEIASSRTIYLGRTTCRTWNSLIEKSTPIRQRLYLPTCLDIDDAKAFLSISAFPPARPNPWTPHLLLNQRSWGSAYPFNSTYSSFDPSPSRPKLWTYAFEMSRVQYARLPLAGPWREILATSPPFTDFWYTRAFYELGSGRAPFVTHWDYNAKLPKSQQRYRVHCASGITLGMIVDAVGELFEKHPNTRFVMVESLRTRDEAERANPEARERPTTRSYLPGSSAERDHGW